MGHSRRIGGQITDKLYYKIGEVSEIVGVEPHVLRYWESEFKVVSPLRASSRQRLYRRGDIDNLIRIKDLLHGQGFTIAGARQALKEEKKSGVTVGSESPEKLVNKLKMELLELKKLLNG